MTTSTPKKFPLVPVVFAVVAIALIAVVVLTFEGGGSDPGTEVGSPEFTGNVLARLPDGAPDPEIGSPIPEVIGQDFDGNEVSITDDGTAKIILFIAHWCPHCQNEVPRVQEWIDSDPLPDGVALYAVSTAVSRTRDNYPPSAWLEREGWTSPVIVDDAGSTLGAAFGLPAYPFFVFTDADNNVLARVTGEIAVTDLTNAVATLAATLGG